MKRPIKLALFISLTCVGLILGYYSWQGPQVSADRLRELATWGLADFLAKRSPGSQALIISNPFVNRPGINMDVVDQEDAGISGLKKGFDGKISVAGIVYPELKEGAMEHPLSFLENPDITTPLTYLVTTNAFNELQDSDPGGDIWVSLIGLPARLDMVTAWQSTDGTKFALLLPDLSVVGSTDVLRNLVVSGKVVALVLARPNVSFDTRKMGRNLRKEFDRRYLLISEDNIDEVLENYPELFRNT